MKYCTFILLFFLRQYTLSAQTISTFAGGGTAVLDRVPATATILFNPVLGTFDKDGNLYFSEQAGGNRVRKISPTGIITTIAGNGTRGSSGDGGPATAALLNGPNRVSFDPNGNILINDGQNVKIRKIDKTTGIITTIAGNGVSAYSGDGGPATAASLENPQDFCFDKVGNLYIADGWSQRIRKVTPAGIISTYAGNGLESAMADPTGSRIDTARLGFPAGVRFDKAGNLIILELRWVRILKVDTNGIITTVAGTGASYFFNGNDIPATTANIDPRSIEFDKFGNLFIPEYRNYRVRYIDHYGIIRAAAGIGTAGFSGDGGPATAAEFLYPSTVVFDSCNNMYIAEASNNRIRKVTYPYCNYLSVCEVAAGEELTVYPNPANDVVHVNGVGSKTYYYLADAVGRVLQAGPLQQGNNEVPLNDLSSGMYLLTLTNKDGIEVRKVVKR